MKNTVLILILCILATLKVTLQGQYAKKTENTFYNAIAFNTLIFATSAVLFAKWVTESHMQTALFGVIFGVLTVLFQSFYIMAMSIGNVSLTVMTVNFSMIIPIVFSVICYNETISVLQIIGILLVVIALILGIEKDSGKSGNVKKWLILALCASLSNGCLSVCQKIFASSAYGVENKGFVAWAYITSSIISVLICSVLKFGKSREKKTVNRIKWILGVSAGVVLAIFQWLNTYAVSVIDSTVLFPSYNGGAMVLSSLSGVIILKDKLSKKQICSVALGTVAVIVLAFL